MIRYYQSTVTTLDGRTRPSAQVDLATRTDTHYNGDKTSAGVMAEATDEQHAAILASGATEKTMEQIASIFPFPAAFPPPPSFGA